MFGKSVAAVAAASMFAVFTITEQQPLFLFGSGAAILYALFAWRGERAQGAHRRGGADHDQDG